MLKQKQNKTKKKKKLITCALYCGKYFKFKTNCVHLHVRRHLSVHSIGVPLPSSLNRKKKIAYQITKWVMKIKCILILLIHLIFKAINCFDAITDVITFIFYGFCIFCALQIRYLNKNAVKTVFIIFKLNNKYFRSKAKQMAHSIKMVFVRFLHFEKKNHVILL